MAPKLKPACILHDRVNLWVLPVLGGMAFLGLLGYYSALKVTNAFIMYIAADIVWLLLEPDAVPSLTPVIVGHHVVTLILLYFPLTHPDLAMFTCYDGICEVNTFFLIARRQWRSQRKLLNVFYWITFVPMRIFLYPCLLLPFWYALEGYPLYEKITVMTAQLLLCCFNFSLLYLSFARTTRNKAITGTSSAEDLRCKLAEESKKE